MSNRKFKCPCPNHYIRKIESDGKHSFWNNDELARMYDSHCQECRKSYKHYSRYDLFTDKVWNYVFEFDPIGVIKFHYSIIKKDGWAWIKNRILKEFIYACHKGYDGYWHDHTWFLFFNFSCRHYEFYDLIEEVYDLDKLEEVSYNLGWGEHEKNRQHQVEVLKRYYKMFGKKIGVNNEKTKK